MSQHYTQIYIQEYINVMYLMHWNILIHNTVNTNNFYTINAHKNMTLASPQITKKYNKKAYSGPTQLRASAGWRNQRE